MTIDANKRLIGTGTVSGAFTNNGRVDVDHGALTFNGLVNGAGNFTGSGTAVFKAGYSPGNSPAAVSLGNVAFDRSATLTIELGGAAPGSGFDQLLISGDAALAGATLEVLAIGDFTPSIGQTFEILDVGGALTGQFAGLDEGALVAQFAAANVFITYAGGDGNDVSLVASSPFTADFDEDGDVDGMDLAQWQGDFGMNALSDADNDGDSDGADFLVWQQQLGSVPAVAATAVVPEPRTFLLFIVASTGFCRTARQKRQELINE